MIHVNLSYGDSDYINSVVGYINQNWNGDVEIVVDSMDLKHYIEWVNGMDAVILDGIMSYALGNISIATYLGKKIFLNRKGVIKKGFEVEDIPFSYIDDIEKMSFEEFKEGFDYKLELGDCSIVGFTYGQVIDNYKMMFRELKALSDMV